ncbi:hypothetical protein N7539_000285 [Penicillium diatomitis]|uniref:Uncharacterized protein n=1 Tax=Penicillium diatomitis TaxID=2819901 RepID=A0A9W9XMV2_9EURO|nr:uncharacterized protein N7539_000285 [Penicillium diatomitis]KAJ5495169.1 hypothetical protein N7539_000285 [Penicillium diatomitis]
MRGLAPDPAEEVMGAMGAMGPRAWWTGEKVDHAFIDHWITGSWAVSGDRMLRKFRAGQSRGMAVGQPWPGVFENHEDEARQENQDYKGGEYRA